MLMKIRMLYCSSQNTQTGIFQLTLITDYIVSDMVSRKKITVGNYLVPAYK